LKTTSVRQPRRALLPVVLLGVAGLSVAGAGAAIVGLVEHSQRTTPFGIGLGLTLAAVACVAFAVKSERDEVDEAVRQAAALAASAEALRSVAREVGDRPASEAEIIRSALALVREANDMLSKLDARRLDSPATSLRSSTTKLLSALVEPSSSKGPKP
jgi:hypothetical protein